MIGVTNKPLFFVQYFSLLNNFIIFLTHIHEWELKWQWFKCLPGGGDTAQSIYLSRGDQEAAPEDRLKVMANILAFWDPSHFIALYFCFIQNDY